MTTATRQRAGVDPMVANRRGMPEQQPGASGNRPGKVLVVEDLPAGAQMLINGAGATFPYPIYSKWFEAYIQVDPEVRFIYQSIGSGGGIRQISERTVDFGASDGPMTD